MPCTNQSGEFPIISSSEPCDRVEKRSVFLHGYFQTYIMGAISNNYPSRFKRSQIILLWYYNTNTYQHYQTFHIVVFHTEHASWHKLSFILQSLSKSICSMLIDVVAITFCFRICNDHLCLAIQIDISYNWLVQIY